MTNNTTIDTNFVFTQYIKIFLLQEIKILHKYTHAKNRRRRSHLRIKYTFSQTPTKHSLNLYRVGHTYFRAREHDCCVHELFLLVCSNDFEVSGDADLSSGGERSRSGVVVKVHGMRSSPWHFFCAGNVHEPQ